VQLLSVRGHPFLLLVTSLAQFVCVNECASLVLIDVPVGSWKNRGYPVADLLPVERTTGVEHRLLGTENDANLDRRFIVENLFVFGFRLTSSHHKDVLTRSLEKEMNPAYRISHICYAYVQQTITTLGHACHDTCIRVEEA
jgi:hypothetical protein